MEKLLSFQGAISFNCAYYIMPTICCQELFQIILNFSCLP